MMQMRLGPHVFVQDHGSHLRIHTESPNGELSGAVLIDDAELENFFAFVEVARSVKITQTRKPRFTHGAHVMGETNRSGAV